MSLTQYPIAELIRIRATGVDRAKFLHNFCTNDINGLPAGHACEAFLANVKARVLAHGYILAAEEWHDLWMLPGDETQLLAHLNKYVITEDVEFESMTERTSAIALTGPADELFQRHPVDSANQWSVEGNEESSLHCLRLDWNDKPILIVVGSSDAIDAYRNGTNIEDSSGTNSDFDRLRIQERFPLIGRDLTEDHLAPEALRNQSAISYTKGCYLGQEPIARLDAMGQVNRVLASLEIHDEPFDETDAVTLTSFSDSAEPHTGLGIVRAADLNSESIGVRTPSGSILRATVTQPKSL